MSFQCTIVTPEAQVLDEAVTQVILPAHDGQVGILTDHAPLLVKIGVGPLRAEMPGGKTTQLFIDGGVAQMKDNVLTIVTENAVPPSEINADAARAELAKAISSEATTPEALDRRERNVNRAKAKLAAVGATA